MKQSEAASAHSIAGKEYPEKDEDIYAQKIVELLQAQTLRLYAKKNAKKLRQIHPKMNGCVKAEIIIEPNLAPELRVGMFKEAVSYPAWIRFSNGNTKPLPDQKKDIRGCGIKIMNVPGDKIIGSGTPIGNHDFILMNTKNFVSKKVGHFYRILNVVTTPITIGSIFPKIIAAARSLPILLRAAAAKVKIDHPLGISYFSTVPFGFGDDTRAVKYGLIPAATNRLEYTDARDKDFLRLNMAATLARHEILYDFCVQFQEDPLTMPIENPTVVWASPFIKLATVRIPTQVFDTPKQNEFGDNLNGVIGLWNVNNDKRYFVILSTFEETRGY